MKTRILLLVLVCMFASIEIASANTGKSKILYVDSYHTEYKWSAAITAGILSILGNRKDVELKIFQMDTKRNKSEQYKKTAALKAKEMIDSWKPDVVITSDDNAAKYLIAPYFKEKKLPFVFCGLNWDATVYGFPTGNITGMTEVSLYKPIIETLKEFSQGNRIGYLASDTTSERKELANISKVFHLDLKARFARTFDELKQAYLDLQEECDMILIRECRSVNGFNHEEMVDFVNNNTSVPTGTFIEFLSHYALITFSKIGEEQGEYAAKTALEILAGKSPQEIPVVHNKKAKIVLNMTLAKKMGIKFPIQLIENAHLISEE